VSVEGTDQPSSPEHRLRAEISQGIPHPSYQSLMPRFPRGVMKTTQDRCAGACERPTPQCSLSHTHTISGRTTRSTRGRIYTSLRNLTTLRHQHDGFESRIRLLLPHPVTATSTAAVLDTSFPPACRSIQPRRCIRALRREAGVVSSSRDPPSDPNIRETH
jgi:hypothetical protein